MSEERMKILQMLSEGKITVAEAEKLLQALGDEQTQKGRPGGRPPWDDWGDKLAREIEVQVKQATSAIPDLVANVSRSFSDAFAGWKGVSFGESDFSEKAERDLEHREPLASGSRLILHNPKGHLQVQTWEQEEVEARVHLSVGATSRVAAESYAAQVRLETEKTPEGLRLYPVLPERPVEVKLCRLDFGLQVPRRVHLDLRTAHGDLAVPAVEGDAVLGNQHGQTRLESATGRVAVKQAHGPVHLGQVGGDLALEGAHGAVEVESVEGAAVVEVSHGPVELNWVGKNLEVALSHGRLAVRGAGGDARFRLSHGPADIAGVKGDLVLEASHGPVRIDETGGRVQATNSHAPLSIQGVGRDLVARNHHGPVDIEKIGGQAVVENHHGPVSLRQVGGSAAVENAFGPVHLQEVHGRVVVRSDRGPVAVESPGAEVVVQNQRANIAVRPTAPVRAAYTLQTERGNVELVLPPDSSVEVQGRVTRGRLETDLPLETSADNQGGQSFRGRFGGGEAQLKVEVDRGNVYLMSH